MTAMVAPILTPNQDDMLAHLEHLFGGYLDGCQDGLIELAWTDPAPKEDGRYPLRHAELFAADEWVALAERAAEVNGRPKTNVYVGAALRKPETSRFARAGDDDFYASACLWSDLDDKDANDQAKHRFKSAIPSFVVRTGEFPHTRHQLWWRMTEVLTDPERVRAGVQGISAMLSGDSSVSNPGRVMRLAGTIAWDQKEGRRPELTRIVHLKTPGLRSYVPAQIERAFPPLFNITHVRAARAAPGPDVGVVRERGALGLQTGKVVDGRERHMVNVICRKLIDYCGHFGAAPTPEDLFEHAWDAYERDTDLTRAGRSKGEFMDKCRSTVRRFEQGKIHGLRTLEDAVEAFGQQREARLHNVRSDTAAKADDGFDAAPQAYEFLDIAGIKSLPGAQWLVHDLIVEDGLGFIYGPPGHGKTFVALSLALHAAYGMTTWWWGKAIRRRGAVVYIAREGLSGLGQRIEAWQRTYGIADDDAAFALVRAGVNFMVEADIVKMIATVEAVEARFGVEPALIFVDTVSRVLPGADENLQREMTIFVAACDALRDRFKATVVGVHHAGKSGDMRGSTVLKGAGDFVFKVEKEDPEDPTANVRFSAEKIKDSGDGWSKLIELSPVDWVVEGEIDGARGSLVALPVDERKAAEQAAPGPDLATCRKILGEIKAAWNSGRPWSQAVQTKAEGRYAPELISRSFGVPAGVADRLVHDWLCNDILASETFDKNSKRKGLKVVGCV